MNRTVRVNGKVTIRTAKGTLRGVVVGPKERKVVRIGSHLRAEYSWPVRVPSEGRTIRFDVSVVRPA